MNILSNILFLRAFIKIVIFTKDLLYFEFKKRNFYFLKTKKMSFKVYGDYLVTTNIGILRVKNEKIKLVSPIPSFGISLNDKFIFISTSIGNRTLILRKERAKFFNKRFHLWDEIYSSEISSAAARYHQISAYKNNLYIANTAQNTITKIDKDGNYLGNLSPFFCEDGHPINTDHNHINSVFAGKNYLLFTAFKANKKGVIGLIGKSRILLFSYKNIGIHDCVLTKEDFIFCDSFNFWEDNFHGSLLYGRKKIDDSYLKNNDANCIRGYASYGDEFLLGSSNYGDRENRYKEQGTLLVGKKRKIIFSTKIFASQINDIIRVDGKKIDEEEIQNMNYRDVKKILIRSFNKPFREHSIENCMIGKVAKKFDKTDIGNFKEYGLKWKNIL